MQIVHFLFPGTSAVDAIVNSVDGQGFLPLPAATSTSAIWGNGTYFARATPNTRPTRPNLSRTASSEWEGT